jgi:hypothetical protein
VTAPYVVQVEVSTHGALRRGVLAAPRALCGVPGGADYTIVIVSPDEVATDAEAQRLAAQVAACSSGMMPTRTTLISWPTDRR